MAAIAVFGVLPFAGCLREASVEYTLFSASGEVLGVNNFGEDPRASQPEEGAEAPEGAYYMVTGSSGAIQNVVIPAEIGGVAVRGVAEQAFIQSRYIGTLVIEEGVSTIGGAAFAFCNALTEVALPSTVSTDYSTFAYCRSLAKVTLPEGVTQIGSRDYYGCESLAEINGGEKTAVELPSTLTCIGSMAFYGCRSLKGAVAIPSGVTAVEDLTFASCSGVTDFVFEGEITGIGYAAFGGCSSLGRLELPSSVKTIDEGAFSYCAALTEVSLPAALEYLGANAFEGVAPESVAMPAGKGAWLYSQKLAEDDPDTEEDEGVAPGSEEAERYLFDFYYDEELENDPSVKGRIPSYELADAARTAQWLRGELAGAFWYFVEA